MQRDTGGSKADLDVPFVTQDDLSSYHALHFPSSKHPAPLSHDDDSLGYYDDGIKRTLTDEQIAMFRHSEIQALLRERRLRRETEENGESQSATLQAEDPESDISRKSASEAASEGHPSAEENDGSHVKLSKNQRRKINIKKARHELKTELMAEKKTNHRMARELDDTKEQEVILDY